MQFVRIARIGTCLVADARDRRGIESTYVAGRCRLPGAARVHGLGPPLLEWGVVQKGVWSGVQNFVRER